MKILFQAVQAVTVELIGVLLVVWMLFGVASVGFRSTGIQQPGMEWVDTPVLARGNDQFRRPESESKVAAVERQKYVDERLGYFSQTYSVAAKQHLNNLLHD